MRQLLLLLLIYICTPPLLATAPKREMRAVWVTTVANIDFPKNPNSSVETQKKEIRYLLDQHKADGINAIFFQVRPTSDAFYASDLEPWSRYLTNEQGKAPSPFYDPLSFMISEAHLRNMEVHAWINPFRVRLKKSDSLCSTHPYTLHPEWGWDYNGKTYFDPGIPEVRNHTKDVVVDIVMRYDVDGIHFDDYFYPYRNTCKDHLPDDKTFRTYGGRFYPEHLEDWRRDNINVFIEDISKAIKEEKSWVKFGISPFGIWKNSTSSSDKLPTNGSVSNYDMLYADVLKWMKEGWIDYCAPQLYWAIGFKQADYTKLLAWWNNHSYGRNIYVGHSLYKIDEDSKEKAWRSHKEIERQIDALRNSDNISGSVFYSSKQLLQRQEVSPLREALKKDYYKTYALMPPMPWIDNKAPNPPSAVQFITSSNGNQILWKAPNYKTELDKPYWYIIYSTSQAKEPLSPENMIAITRETNYTLPIISKGGEYAITALDRLQNESQPIYINIGQNQLSSIVFHNTDFLRNPSN